MGKFEKFEGWKPGRWAEPESFGAGNSVSRLKRKKAALKLSFQSELNSVCPENSVSDLKRTQLGVETQFLERTETNRAWKPGFWGRRDSIHEKEWNPFINHEIMV